MTSKLHIFAAASIFALTAAACGGGSDVDNNGVNGDPPITEVTPTPEPTPEPTPVTYTVRVTFTNIHIYENSEPFGAGELYFTFAVDSTVRYSTQISAGNNADYNPADFGVTSIDHTVLEGEPLYLYIDGYDDDQPNANDPMGTVNTGWYAGDVMLGSHTVASEAPYRYDITYKIEWAQ
jgi:hypothetical protein